MKQVLAFGEALIDLVYQGNKFVGSCPGGSVVNTCISLGRCGIAVQLMTETGDDENGHFIREFLQDNQINIEYSPVYIGRKTASSRALLDDQGDATYTFHKDYPENRFSTHLPELDENTILLFGSFSSLEASLQQVLSGLLQRAVKGNSLIFYDPNIRQHILEPDSEKFAWLKRNLAIAHIIRGSDEDFMQVFGTNCITQVWDKVQPSVCKLLVITRGSKGVEAFNGELIFHLSVFESENAVVSTIGAGDAFNAGMIAALCRNPEILNEDKSVKPEFVNNVLRMGLRFSAEVCGTMENFVGMDFCAD
jgi:fructokinase